MGTVTVRNSILLGRQAHGEVIVAWKSEKAVGNRDKMPKVAAGCWVFSF